ncbi:Uncharacterised protein [Listeria grayi]|uniref:Uncharacterized protein n=1 Tax=Listeria grayi TaxID=1641 RepID=A0A378MGL6_LISGR|nr:hypothetical protein [Listeria grayi]STY45510.1 Uncharacterised protein [Listeria grayi]
MELKEIENKISEIIRLIHYEENRQERIKEPLSRVSSEKLVSNYYKELEELRNKRNILLKDQ